MNYLHNVIHVFVGSPKRAGWTILSLAVIFFGIWPHLFTELIHSIMTDIVVPAIQETLGAVVRAVGPFVYPFLIFLILWGALIALRKSWKGGKK